jgi:hypothetical protein
VSSLAVPWLARLRSQPSEHRYGARRIEAVSRIQVVDD